MYILLSLLVVALLLIVNEIWWRNKNTHAENPRKIIHIIVGSFIAFWPLYMSWNWIRLISLALLLGIIMSKVLNIFTSIHDVERFTLGEFFFAAAIGGLTFVTKTDWIYTASLLQMSLSDGLAAIIGVHFGQRNSYKVFGSTKSLAGSAAFFITSLAILFIAREIVMVQISDGFIVLISLAATIVENLAVYGLDNLLLPLVTAIMLSHS